MQEFSVYFLSSRLSIQQDMVNSLRSLSTSGSHLEEEKERKAVRCPHYKGQRIRANGKLKCVQRYLCNGGCKNVRETTGKFWFALKKKDKMKTSLYDELWGDRIRKSGKETGIAMQTSFDCCPKLETSFSSGSVSGFEGIVGVMLCFFNFRKRALYFTNTAFEVVTTVLISKKYINKVYQAKLDKATVFAAKVTEVRVPLQNLMPLFIRSSTHQKGRTVAKIEHVQNLNTIAMRLRKFMKFFNGVATTYLQNYLNWFLVFKKERIKPIKWQQLLV